MRSAFSSTLRKPALALLQVVSALLLSACHNPPSPLEIPAGENPARWKETIEKFAEADRADSFSTGLIVFVGSSSIRLWKTLADDMDPVPVLNRGFGGSKLFDAIYYSDRLVTRHQPRVVVVFSGTNDIAGENAKSAVQVRDLFRQFVARLRRLGDDPVICNIAITPTLAREEHLATVREANRLIRIDCDADPRLEFVDPSVDLVDATGRPDPKWFVRDRLHLNADGYRVWTEHIRPRVHRVFERECRLKR